MRMLDWVRKVRRKVSPPLEGFHGDTYLLALADSVLAACDWFVETGTHVGTTLAYVARKHPHLNCLSCEPNGELRKRAQEAIEDYDKAVNIYTRLVNDEGHKELTIDLAHTLNNESWLYVSSSNSEFRDAVKGKQYATRACELTDWKESGLLDTLAAACAASGDFDAAVKWQLKSIDLAPDEQKAELRERLERYRATEGNPPT